MPQYVEPVPYGPGVVVDVTKPLWIPCADQLSPEEWAALAVVYPELGRLPNDADFRKMHLLIEPPETRDLAGLTEELEHVRRALEYPFVIQEYFVSDATPMRWVVVCRRGEGNGYLTMYTYRLGQPEA